MDHLRRLGKQHFDCDPPETRTVSRDASARSRIVQGTSRWSLALASGATDCRATAPTAAIQPHMISSGPRSRSNTPNPSQYGESLTRLHRDLKGLEFDHKPKGAFGLGFFAQGETRPAATCALLQGTAARNRGCLCHLYATIFGVWRLCLLPGLWPAQLDSDPGKESGGSWKDVGDGRAREERSR